MEELHKVGSVKVRSSGASVPMELGCLTLLTPKVDVFTHLSEHQTIGISM